MHLMSKFDSIEIKNDNRVSKEDLEFCKDVQKECEGAKDLIAKVQNLFKESAGFDFNNDSFSQESNNSFIYRYDWKMLWEQEEKIKDILIEKIVRYFNETYKVKISYYKIKEKYENKEITYQTIIDEIFEQLDGFSFEEKALEEFKNKTNNIYYYNEYRNEHNIEIKNKKLIVKRYFVRSGYSGYSIYDEAFLVFDALNHFETSSLKGSSELRDKYRGWNLQDEDFKKYNPYSLEKVSGIKFYKNGKMEIEFKNNELATEFAREYLGYTQQEEAA